MKRLKLTRLARPCYTRVWEFRYENPEWLRDDGTPHFRTIKAGSGQGRFKLGTKEQARELAERRLSEQFGKQLFAEPDSGIDPGAIRVINEPRLHQDNYVFVSVRRVK